MSLTIAVPTLLNRQNYVVWEAAILKSLRGKSSLVAEIKGERQFERVVEDDISAERQVLLNEESSTKHILNSSECALAEYRNRYVVTHEDYTEHSGTSDLIIASLLGFQNLQRWKAMQHNIEIERVPSDRFINLSGILAMHHEHIQLQTQLSNINYRLEVNKQRQAAKNSVYLNAQKTLREEAGALCNQILSDGVDGLIERSYLEELKCHHRWREMISHQAVGDARSLMETLKQLQEESKQSSKFDVIRLLWKLQPEYQEQLQAFDVRLHETVEYLRRDSRVPVDDEMLIYIYADNLRYWSHVPTVSQFLSDYLDMTAAEKALVTYDSFRRKLLSELAKIRYYGNSNQPEEMIVSAAIERKTPEVTVCQWCNKKNHLASECRRLLSLTTKNTKGQTTEHSSALNPNWNTPKPSASSAGHRQLHNNSNTTPQPAAAPRQSGWTRPGHSSTSESKAGEDQRRKQKHTIRAAIVDDNIDADEYMVQSATIVTQEDAEDDFIVCPTLVVSNAVQGPMSSIQLDNGANTHILNDAAFFLDGPKPLDSQAKLYGIYVDGPTRIAQGGKTRHFGFSFYEPKARNILSQSKLEKEGFDTTPHRTGRRITAWTVTKGDISIHFKLKNGIFLADIPQYLTVATMTRSQSRVGYTNPDSEDANMDQSTTPEDNEDGELQTDSLEPRPEEPRSEAPGTERPYSVSLGRTLTRAEEEKIRLVGQLHAAFNHQGKAAEMRLVSNGHLLNCALTRKDIELYYEQHPTCPGCLKGRLRAPPSVPFTPPSGAAMGAYWEGDLMFIGQRKYVVLVEVISNFAITIPVSTRHEGALSRAAKVWHTYLDSFFKTKTVLVYTDRESALQALAGSHPSIGITVDRTAAENHANRVESLIRVIKERCRSIIHSLPYKLPAPLVDNLVRHIVVLRNYCPATTGSTETPMERVRGLKPDFQDLLIPFGATGHAYVPAANRNKEAATSEESIFVGFDSTNPRNKMIYSISTKRIISRLKFIPSPISANALFELNRNPVSVQDFDSSQEENIVSAATLQMEDDVSNLTIRQAMNRFGAVATEESLLNELLNMERMDVFQFISDVESGQTIFPSKTFLKAKYADGTFVKLKSRLVLRGDLQKINDKSALKSPTILRGSLNTILALNKCIRGELYSVDIPAAFLFAPLKEKIYMALPKDISDLYVRHKPSLSKYLDKQGRLVVRLKKSIYGLRQAPANFYRLMREKLTSFGYMCSASDPCIFSRRNDKEVTTIAIHVDDLLVSSNSETHIRELKARLAESFGELSWNQREFTYLGMRLKREEDCSVTVDMVSYTLDLLEKFADDVGPTVKIRDPSDLKLFTRLEPEAEGADPDSLTKYKSIVMGLMYLCNVRVDILKEVVILSMMTHRPGPSAWSTLRRVLAFLKKYPNHTINLGADSSDLHVYSDAGYASHYDSKSHTGIYVTLGQNGGPVLVKSKKQTMVTQSSTEAEMFALTEAVRKAMPIARLLVELGFNSKISICIEQDNQSTLHLAKVGEGLGGKAKHFRVRFHFLKELHEEGLIQMKYCQTKDMLADILTKPMVGRERSRQVLRMMFHSDQIAFDTANDEALRRVLSNRQ